MSAKPNPPRGVGNRNAPWKTEVDTRAAAGKPVGLNYVDALSKKYGISPGVITTFAARQNYNVGQKAREAYGTGAAGGGQAAAGPEGETLTIFEQMVRAQENLAHIQGGYATSAAQIGANATVSAAGLRASADKEAARAYADAQKFSSERALEGVKYGADKESEWRQSVANIEVKGKLDLQPIINAGLEKVAGIEAQAQRDVAETTGKYSLESMKERTAADKSIGKMQLAGGMYGLLGSIFG